MILLRSLPFCIFYFNFLRSQYFFFNISESETSSASSSSTVDEFYFSADDDEEILSMSSARVVMEVLYVDGEGDLALRTLKDKQKVIDKDNEGDLALRILKGKQKLIGGDLAKGKQKETGETSHTLTYYCAICMDSKSEGKMFRNQNCSHLYCNDCIGRHVAAKIQENILKVKCPEPKCKVVIESQNCRSIIPKEVLDRWEDALCENVLLGSEKFYCPFKDCSVMMICDAEEDITVSECPHCKRLFCAQCKVSWHSGLDCREFNNLKQYERGREDLQVLDLAKNKSWRRCPKCKFYVEKTEGCSHISCRCGQEFCYVCGSSWSTHHVCHVNNS